MDVICYVCDEKTTDWHQNLVETKSKHTKTPIVTFISQLLGDYVSQRNVNDESNCICSECLSRLYSYDWMRMKVKEQEKELRALILKSEASFLATHIKSEFEFVNPTELIQADYNQRDCDDIKPEPMHTDDGPGDNVETVPDIVIKNFTPDDEDDAAEWSDVESDNGHNANDDDDDDDDDLPLKTESVKKKEPKKSTASTSNSKFCEMCGEKLKNVKTVQAHMKIHTKTPGKLTCYVCLYEVSDKEKDKFKDHAKKHARATSKQCCVICNEGGTEYFDLKHHVRSQHNANLSCDTCGKLFVYASVLRLHLKSHIEHLPEQCDHCKKSFPDKETLEAHKEIHVQAVCTFCGQQFTTKRKCKRHELRHTNDSKKFKCSLCPAALDTERGLKLHSVRKHGEQEED